MSTEEYTLSSQQYDERLGKIVQRRVKLETDKKNYVNFRSRKDKLRMEKATLEKLMQGLQRDYLQKGKLESGVYENRMKSYVARLSEIEETIAVEETQEKVKSGKGLLSFLRPAPKEAGDGKGAKADGKAGAKVQFAEKEKPAAKEQHAGKESQGSKIDLAEKEKPAGKEKEHHKKQENA